MQGRVAGIGPALVHSLGSGDSAQRVGAVLDDVAKELDQHVFDRSSCLGVLESAGIGKSRRRRRESGSISADVRNRRI